MATAATISEAGQEVNRFLAAARPAELRTIRKFATDEIYLPNGPFVDQRMRPEFQPAAFAWFDQLDKWAFNRHIYTGPVQSGKTLAGLVVPMLWVLFEQQETAILGAPKADLAAEKWREDFLPVIKNTRFASLLPTHGAGSKGGTPKDHVQFRNGVTLRFMSGQGSDDERSAFTSRWVFITEVDKMDTATDISREADPVSQMEDRTMAFDMFGGGYVFLECTVSTTEGRIWREYQSSTAGVVAILCPHCKVHVCPEREHFVGWEDAADEIAASESGHFACPSCGVVWSQAERLAANADGVLKCSGQTIENGKVVGAMPPSLTFGFRMTAANNCFVSDAKLATQEWRKARESAESKAGEELEKTIRQKSFAIPFDPPELSDLLVTEAAIVARSDKPLGVGQLPTDLAHFAVGCDLRKREGHWVAMCGRKEIRNLHVPDYGRFEIDSDKLGVEQAFLKALRAFRVMILEAWEQPPSSVWIDAGYKGKIVYRFIKETREQLSNDMFMPSLGRSPYNTPKVLSKVVRHIGNNYHIEWSAKYSVFIVIVNSDEWKSELHERLSTPPDQPGGLSLYSDRGDKRTHAELARHWTAEKQKREFVEGKGLVTKWYQLSRVNHWLDAAYDALAGLDYCGYTVEDPEEIATRVAAGTQEAAKYADAYTNRHGQSFLATER